MVIAAGYLRVSTEEQAEQGISIPAQKNRILSYFAAQGWELYDFYIDDGFSGKDLNRPNIQRLINDAKKQKFKAIVVIKLDRLSRRQKDVLYLLEDVFDANHIGFKSVLEPFDTTTPFGKAAIGMMAVFAQLERETIIERVKDAKRESAKQGRFMGGRAPYGYKHIPGSKTVEINDLEAPIIRFIFDAYMNRHGYQNIADQLNTLGTPPPATAAQWQRSTIRAIVNNPFYAGLIRHKDTLYDGKHQPIISREHFYDIQNRKKAQFTSKSTTGLLTGIIYCSECGARMRLKSVWKNPRNPVEKISYYVCYSQDKSSQTMIRDIHCHSGYKRANELDDTVIKCLFQYMYNECLLKEISNDLLKNNMLPKQDAAVQIKKELENINAKKNKWYNAFENDLLTYDEFSDRIKKLHDRRNYLEKQLKISEANSQTPAIEKTEVINLLKNFRKIWGFADPMEQRQIITNLIDSVRVSKNNEIEILFT